MSIFLSNQSLYSGLFISDVPAMFSDMNHSDVTIACVCSESAQPPFTLSSIMITKVAIKVPATQELVNKAQNVSSLILSDANFK